MTCSNKYVIEPLGDPRGILIVDETGFLKKGDQSGRGLAPELKDCGPDREPSNQCHFGLSKPQGHALIDRRLYLPKSWTDEPERCLQAGIPSDNEFATKPALARQMLQRALRAGLPVGWVTADEVYGSDSKFRQCLEKRRHRLRLWRSPAANIYFSMAFVIGWTNTSNRSRQVGGRLFPVDPASKGDRRYRWAFVRFGAPTEQGFNRGLLIRRSLHNSDDLAYYFTHAKPRTRISQLVQVAGARWAIEECFEQSKQETGLDEYEVRSWTGWYRHITLSMFAYAFLSSVRAASNSPPQRIKNSPAGNLIPFTVPEVRRLLYQLVLIRLPPQDQVWLRSLWRRRHQATARKHHYKTRGHPLK